MISNKTITAFLVSLVAVVGLSGLFVSWKYEAKIQKMTADQAIKDRNSLEQHAKEIEAKNQENRAKAAEYEIKIKEIDNAWKSTQIVNTELSSSLDRMRKHESELRTKLLNLSQQTVNEYAITASRAFEDVSRALEIEQRAHQETSRRADQYYESWWLLDQSWPENK